MRFTPKLGTIINQKYRLIEVLGTGGWGVTYLAEDLNNKRKVALKALSLNGLSDWKQVELFEREAKVLKSLNHPAIPKYLEYFSVDTPDNRYFYLAQELAPGKSLTTIEKGGDLNYRYWGGHTVWTEVSSPESALILFRSAYKGRLFTKGRVNTLIQ